MKIGNQKYFMYVGTYKNRGGEGIYAYTLDITTGKPEYLGLCAELLNPSFMVISNDEKYLYTICEVETDGGEKRGAVAGYRIDGKNGSLTPTGMQSTNGKGPCHINIDKRDKHIYTANYTEGSFNVFPLDADGAIKPASSTIYHRGSGPNPARQEMPHVHYIALTPDQKHLCVVDLGTDMLAVYDLDEKSIPSYSDVLSLRFKGGCGPRHMDFHPNSKFAYMITELSSEVVTLTISPQDSKLTPVQYISALPSGYTGESTGGAIRISPDGRFLYASNRGHESIAVFSIDEISGMIEPVAYTFVNGESPRDISIDPTGTLLFAANQLSDNITVFKIDSQSGKLEQVDMLDIPSPVCVKFIHMTL